MSGRTVDPVAEIGWYGKIPAAGDFVYRRLPRPVITEWDMWLQQCFAQHRRAQQIAGEDSGLSSGQVWQFLLPGGVGQGWLQAGCIAPSRDRVGRRYAVVAMMLLDPGSWRTEWAPLLETAYLQMRSGLRDVIQRGSGADHLDRLLLQLRETLAARWSNTLTDARRISSPSQDILDILNAGMTTPEVDVPVPSMAASLHPALSSGFNPHAHTSLWWASAGDGVPMRTCTHGGRLNVMLFQRLFASAGMGGIA
ncbi:type VI secretion system-associated protein TagF [Paracandidimonas soli]|uniref:type VI secretion system-associated protein TagF n=1 Tax=Paracandidimonas soli TaxID=1917182 RepID=UPI000ACB88D8